MPNFKLYLGCNIPNTRLSVSENELLKFLDEFEELEDLSLIPMIGKHQGTYERSYQLKIFNTTKAKAFEIAKRYKKEFDQISVGIEEFSSNYEEV